MTVVSSDRIEKKILLRAPVSRVWRALTRADEFGAWFGMKLEGEFEAGKPIHGRITHPGYEHLSFDLMVESVDAERLFSYRWHPHAIDPKMDYSSEPMTLVEFRLAPSEGGTVLTVVESGFDRIPAERRALALRMNTGGWEQQMTNIQRYDEG